MLPRRNNSAHSLASLVIAPDDHLLLQSVRAILDTQPRARPPTTATQLAPYLFMGSLKNASDVTALRSLGITHVLNCASNRNLSFGLSPYSIESGISHYCAIAAEDHTDYDIMRHFNDVYVFLRNCKQNGHKALVHCNLGINRSGALSAAFLMVEENMPLLSVIKLLKQKRRMVLTNRGFQRQLVRFARMNGCPDVRRSRKDASTPSVEPVNGPVLDRRHVSGVRARRTRSEDAQGTCQTHLQTHATRRTPASSSKLSATTAASRTATAGSIINHELATHFNGLSVDRSRLGERVTAKRPTSLAAPVTNHHGSRSNNELKHEQHQQQALPKLSEKSRTFDGLGSTSEGRRLKRFENNQHELRLKRTTSALETTTIDEQDEDETDAKTSPTFEYVLSSTRPLRVYKRCVTDTQLYQRPHSSLQYKRADTVATSCVIAEVEEPQPEGDTRSLRRDIPFQLRLLVSLLSN